MLNNKLAVFFIAAVVVALPTSGFAAFNMTSPSTSSGGSGNAMGTASITSEGPFDVPEGGGFLNDATVTPTGTAISFQQSHAIAWDGTANASTSGTITETGSGVNAGDTVTATTSGSTIATAQKENDPVRPTLWNEATGTLIAAGGSGTVLSQFFNTTTGFMLADSDAQADSTGSTDATAGTDATANSKGAASVTYGFAGAGGPETLSVADANNTANADINGDTTVADTATATARAWSNGILGWTNSPVIGVTIGGLVGLNAESQAEVIEDTNNGRPTADSSAAGSVDLSFQLRPITNPIFALTAAASGSATSDASFNATFADDEEEEGLIQSAGGKNALGFATTAATDGDMALAWLHSTVSMYAYDDDFQGSGNAEAINPAQFAEEEPVYDPSVTVTHGDAVYNAAMGSSSLINAQVNASAEVTGDDEDEGLDNNEALFVSAFGFAVAAQNRASQSFVDSDSDGTLDAGEPILFNLATENAFTGQGSIALTDNDHDDDDLDVTVSADALNLYGTASSPSFSASMDNGQSSASVVPVFSNGDWDYMQRAASASADSLTGTNYPTAVAHNEVDGLLDFTNVPWWANYMAPTFDPGDSDAQFEHLAVGFIGAGGN